MGGWRASNGNNAGFAPVSPEILDFGMERGGLRAWPVLR